MKKKKEMKIKKILYFIIILLIIVDTCFFTFNYLIINKDISGKVVFNNNYSDILFGDVFINGENNISVKLNKNDMSMSVSIKNLEFVKDKELFYFDLVNIGNRNVSFDGGISNFDSNMSSNDIFVNISSEDNVILGGESKRIYVNYNYINSIISENSYLNFNINFKFY